MRTINPNMRYYFVVSLLYFWWCWLFLVFYVILPLVVIDTLIAMVVYRFEVYDDYYIPLPELGTGFEALVLRSPGVCEFFSKWKNKLIGDCTLDCIVSFVLVYLWVLLVLLVVTSRASGCPWAIIVPY